MYKKGFSRGFLQGKTAQAISSHFTAVFWGIINSAFVLDKSLTPLRGQFETWEVTAELWFGATARECVHVCVCTGLCVHQGFLFVRRPVMTSVHVSVYSGDFSPC